MANSKILGAIALAALALAGCTEAKYQVVTQADERSTADPQFNSILVAVPADGGADDQISRGSGQAVAQEFVHAFTRYSKSATMADADLKDRQDLLDEARKTHETYLLIPDITHWEGHWAGILGQPGRSTINVTFVDVASGKDIYKADLDTTSKTAIITKTTARKSSIRAIDSFVNGLYSTNRRKPVAAASAAPNAVTATKASP